MANLKEALRNIRETRHGESSTAPCAPGTYNPIPVNEDLHVEDFDKVSAERYAFTELVKWLQTGHRFSWFQRQAKSDNSALVSFLVHSKKPLEQLKKVWKLTRILTLSLTLESLDVDIQKEDVQRVLLQSLLQQIFRELRGGYLGDIEKWAWSHPTEFFSRMSDFGLGCCIFIDGLDNVQNNLGQITEVINTIIKSERIKVCVVAQPSSTLTEAFARLNVCTIPLIPSVLSYSAEV